MAENLEPASDDQTRNDDELLKEAQSRFSAAQEASSEIRKLALEDLEFSIGKQWHDADITSRNQDGRPCLVINKIPQFIQQITNDQRQNRPSIKVHPVDDKGDVETAKVMQGLIRHIEYNSNAEVAYDTAFEYAARIGFGYFRIITQYASPVSFEQDILIKRIKNPFTVTFDPYSSEPDGSDASFAFITEELSKEEFKNQYPKSELNNADIWSTVQGDEALNWLPSGAVRIAEYFYKEMRDETVYLLSNGQTVKKSEMDQVQVEPGVSVVKERETQVPVICWVKMNAVEILEKTEWPGTYIPIVPVYGNEITVNGKRILEGIVRNAKDPARMYNYFASAESEAIALAPRAPFIADPKQIEGYEAIWDTANRKNHSYLPYNMIVNNQVLPPPQRSMSDISTQAITQARMLASDDLKATTGIYDAALGAKSNETSGVAIQRRNVQAQTSNFHFIDNLTRSLRHAGRILIDLLPKVYDTARTARIVSDEGEQRVVRVNDPNFQENGKPTLYALDAGKYDVAVDVGPSFQTKRQEAASAMLEMTKAVPQMMQIAPDLIVKSMDFPGATELAERFKKTLDPKLIDDGKGKQDIPPQVQMQMQQYGQMVEQMTAKIHELQDAIDNKRVELESKERIEMAKIQAEIEITMAKLGSQESIQLMNHQIAEIKQRLQMLKMHEPMFSDGAQAPQQPSQDMSAPQAGGEPAMAEAQDNQDPTGGVPPGSSMEGFNQP